MTTLILPVAGRSSRFPGMRPKWMLTMPDGKLMIEKAVELLHMADYERVVVVALREHVDSYFAGNTISSVLAGIGHAKIDICILNEPTSSQSETVASALLQADITGPFFVKDCDNMFHYRWSGGNEVAALDLNNVGLIDAKNKSYIEVDSLGNISNIVEKHVISNYFCCGGYGFDSAQNFISHFRSIKGAHEVYISHIIYSMLMAGESFRMGDASAYVDWGTLREYRHYTKSFVTVFCDVDGVLFYNGSKFGKNGWRTEPIAENIQTISRLQKAGCLYLIITSSRPESEVEYIQEQLAENGVQVDRFIMSLPHARRILINDYSVTNPYPTSISINLERDSKQLSSILDSITG